MNLTLAMVTCGPQLEAALLGNGMAAPSVVRLAGVAPRSTLLLAAVDLLLEDLGVEPQALGTVVVSRGPGSFTGIRAGLASAAGLAAATAVEVRAFDSLLTQAARCEAPGTVWTAQPGRRGEVYAQPYRLESGQVPRACGEIRTVALTETGSQGPWVAAEALDLGPGRRAVMARTAAEALLWLVSAGLPSQPVEPLYVDPPPVHGGAG